MPRKGPAPKRPLVNDPVYGSQLVTQLVNKVLLDGKKSLAERIVYGALEQARDKTGTDPVVTLKRAMDNVKPALEVRSRRVGGATYQVPVEVRPDRSTTLALRWPTRFSMPATASAPPSSDAKTPTRWPRRTGRSRTTAGDSPPADGGRNRRPQQHRKSWEDLWHSTC
jgi:ribosomal protein S7